MPVSTAKHFFVTRDVTGYWWPEKKALAPGDGFDIPIPINILTLRALEQSGRFDRAWRLLAGTYLYAVRLHDNVIDLSSRRSRH